MPEVDTPVLLALQGPGETELVAAINATPGITVTRRCGDVAELLGAAGARVGAIAVVTSSYLGIDRVLVARLHQMGVQVLGVASPEDMDRVAALGVDATVDGAAGTAAVIAALGRLRRVGPPPPPPAAPGGASGGSVVTVWGTTGAPGRTTVAVNLAHALAGFGSVGLIDADTRAPSVAQTLGMLEESSAIAIATRAASQGRLDAATLDTCFPLVGGIPVMSGLTRPDRWREVPGAGLEVVVSQARLRYDWTVLDVAGGWESEDTGFETAFAPARNGAQATALRHSDVVVVVGAADPVGMHRLVTLMADKPRLQAREVVVVTKLRSAVAGPSPAHAVREALARFAGVGEAILVTDDRSGLDAALMAGEYLAVASPRSPALHGVEELARTIAGEPRKRQRAAGRRALAGSPARGR